MFAPKFASPPDAPGGATGFHIVPSHVNTSLVEGVSLPVVTTSLKESTLITPTADVTLAFVKYKLLLPSVKLFVVLLARLVLNLASV